MHVISGVLSYTISLQSFRIIWGTVIYVAILQVFLASSIKTFGDY